MFYEFMVENFVFSYLRESKYNKISVEKFRFNKTKFDLMNFGCRILKIKLHLSTYHSSLM